MGFTATHMLAPPHMKRKNPDFWPDAIGAIFCTVLFLAVILVPAYFEASAFNRLTTGPKVSIIDAIFLDLRVEAK